jgi:hypothetical protein
MALLLIVLLYARHATSDISIIDLTKRNMVIVMASSQSMRIILKRAAYSGLQVSGFGQTINGVVSI